MKFLTLSNTYTHILAGRNSDYIAGAISTTLMRGSNRSCRMLGISHNFTLSIGWSFSTCNILPSTKWQLIYRYNYNCDLSHFQFDITKRMGLHFTITSTLLVAALFFLCLYLSVSSAISLFTFITITVIVFFWVNS